MTGMTVLRGCFPYMRIVILAIHVQYVLMVLHSISLLFYSHRERLNMMNTSPKALTTCLRHLQDYSEVTIPERQL